MISNNDPSIELMFCVQPRSDLQPNEEATEITCIENKITK